MIEIRLDELLAANEPTLDEIADALATGKPLKLPKLILDPEADPADEPKAPTES